MAEELRLKTSLEWREVEGEIVALDLENSLYLATNRSGALMWRHLSEGTTKDQLVESLAQAFALTHEIAERDVAAFLGQLEIQGYLSDD